MHNNKNIASQHSLVQFIQMAITRIDSLNTMDYEVLPRTVKLD
uniref:Uncharacterized protein n=1 Tax=Anguilla anguilla TaxID=7936 RepID=A0A0E9QYX0_ANGAN